MSKKLLPNNRLGFLIDALDLNFQNQILQGVKHQCRLEKVDLIVYSGALQYDYNDRTSQYEIVQNYISSEEIDGLLVLAGAITAHYSTEKTLEILGSFHDIPRLTIAMKVPGIQGVTVDNQRGVKDLLNHLFNDHQCKKIGFLKGPPRHQEADMRLSTYQEYLLQNDLPLEDHWIIDAGAFDEEAGYNALLKLDIEIIRELDALLCADDSTALGAMRAIKERGFSVPDDILLCGFDNLEDAAFTIPSLTTVHQPFFDQGAAAVQQLLKRLRLESYEENLILSTKLIVRESCGCSNHSLESDYLSSHIHDLQFLPFQKIKPLEEMLKDYPNNWNKDEFFREFEILLRRDFQELRSLSPWIPIVDYLCSQLVKEKWDMGEAFSFHRSLNLRLLNYLHLEEKRNRLRNDSYRYKVHLISHRILSSFRSDNLYGLLYESLSLIDIQSFFLVQYDRTKENQSMEAPKKGRLVVAIQNNSRVLKEGETVEISSGELLPKEYMNKEGGQNLIFLPISFKSEHYGYVMFSLSNRVIISLYEVLRISIGTALHSCYLMEKIEKNTRQKTNLFINIAHEMKTPITLVSSYINRFLDESEDPRDIRIAKENLSKLKRDMVNFLDNEKIDRGIMLYENRQNIDLCDFIGRKILSFQELARQSQIEIEWNGGEEIYYVCDPSALDRILNNLLENALRYNTEGGSIRLNLKKKFDSVVLEVGNNTTPLEDHHLSRLFDPYYQITQNRNSRQGIGMGLNIVRKILHEMGGDISLDQREDWISFQVILPVLNSQELLDSAPFVPREQGGSRISHEIELVPGFYNPQWSNLLIVEDNRQLIYYMKEELSKQYNVFYALSAEEALEMLESIPKPDLILSDIMMDQIDGLEFYQELLNHQKHCCTPFLFVSAKSGKDIKLKALEYGAIDFIAKPFEIKELSRKIDSIIRIHMAQKNDIEESVKKEMKLIFEDTLEVPPQVNGNRKSDYWNRLSEREKKIVYRLIQGQQYKEIAYDLSLSINTVKTYIKRIYSKFEINNKMELIQKFPR